MAAADAFRSHAAWSNRKPSKSDRTASSHPGEVGRARDPGPISMVRSSFAIGPRLLPPDDDVKARGTFHPMALVHGGRLVARALARHGTTHLFTLCGGHIQAIYDGCLDENIRVIDVRHEQTAGHAADG